MQTTILEKALQTIEDQIDVQRYQLKNIRAQIEVLERQATTKLININMLKRSIYHLELEIKEKSHEQIEGQTTVQDV